MSSDRVMKSAIATVLLLTMGFSAVAFSYLKNPAAVDPWTYPDVDQSPETALNDIGAVLAGSRGRFIRNVPPEARTESNELHFEWRKKPLVVRVVPNPSDPLRGKLVWDTPGGARTICRGVRPGGFRVMDTADGWVLRLEAVRMDRDGHPADLVATKTVKRGGGK